MTTPLDIAYHLANLEDAVRDVVAQKRLIDHLVPASPYADVMRITPPPPRDGWAVGECFACPAPRREHDGWGSTTTGCAVPFWRLIPVVVKP